MNAARTADEDAAPLKDAVLNELGDVANIAQFVSFGPGPAPKQRYSRLFGYEPGRVFSTPEEAILALLGTAPEGSVNVRSFHPDQPKDSEFMYGLRRIHDVAAAIRRLASNGFYTIVNETVDVNDGGVSGVSYAGLLEFAPGDTPRAVEKAGIVSIAQEDGLRILEVVYGFRPELAFARAMRVEFSVHPIRRGFRRDHTILWELEEAPNLHLTPNLTWPNRFSRALGDKAFGLLVADTIGLPVPATTVVLRTLPPFSFGEPTGTGEHWIRTCPAEPVPGLFTTHHGWMDPFRLMANEDPDNSVLASVLSQEGVAPKWSGAILVGENGRAIVEGVAGPGDEFMQGRAAPQRLPSSIVGDVLDLQRKASGRLGPVRMEWVHDEVSAWVVQLNASAAPSVDRVIYPGEATVWRRFDVSSGIGALRELIGRIERSSEGVVIVGDVGITSHMGDLLRRAGVPSRIEPLPL